MIASLRGRLTLKRAPSIIIECHGVGYEVETPMSTFLELPPSGDELFLFTHMVVREDSQTLYGFATEEEQALFRMLLKISGVGAKMGLAVLSSMSVEGFRRCVEYEDAASLVKVPGIGKKTAERLIIEMRDRIDKRAQSRKPSML
jgi:Holliday junction DNA helicase RuvA